VSDCLVVHLFGRRVGELSIWGELRSPEDWTFRYDETYAERLDAIPLTLSLPLEARTFDGARVRNWFCNLLPEGRLRHALRQRGPVTGKLR